MYVFVYGTLKRGYLANMYLEGSTYIGDGITVDGFSMYDGGYPKLVDNGVQPLPVVGEVYEVDSETMAVLDDYESYPTLYDRKIIAVMVDQVQYDCIVYVYNCPTESLSLVEPNDHAYCW